MVDPLILTLALRQDDARALTAMRDRFFPDRGYRLPAHLTLFHKLPGDRLGEIGARLDELTAGMAPLPLRLGGLRVFSGGTAVEVESDALRDLRAGLAADWQDWLTRQDRSFRPHITIQNKVAPDRAARDREEIAALHHPRESYGTALLLWHYRGGPWDAAGRYDFRGGIE